MGVTLDRLGFDSELQALYTAVSSGKTGQKRNTLNDSGPAAENNHVSEHHQHITDVPTGYCSLTLSLIHESQESFQPVCLGKAK